jgi:hypothetical protein
MSVVAVPGHVGGKTLGGYKWTRFCGRAEGKKAQEKNARRATVPLTMEAWKAKFKGSNDTDWMDPESAQ